MTTYLPTTQSAPIGYQPVEFLDIPPMHDSVGSVEDDAARRPPRPVG
jgi:hypothetical protein